jgi:hypothetical protein
LIFRKMSLYCAEVDERAGRYAYWRFESIGKLVG